MSQHKIKFVRNNAIVLTIDTGDKKVTLHGSLDDAAFAFWNECRRLSNMVGPVVIMQSPEHGNVLEVVVAEGQIMHQIWDPESSWVLTEIENRYGQSVPV